jgi:hypothetical protein|tara:strand:+ start:258 stop:419 length:162 start_codon:yes stop_codon:yes gene_type:complete
MKEKLRTHKLVGVSITDHVKSVAIGKLRQKGLVEDAYWSMGKNYYWVKRGNKL